MFHKHTSITLNNSWSRDNSRPLDERRAVFVLAYRLQKSRRSTFCPISAANPRLPVRLINCTEQLCVASACNGLRDTMTRQRNPNCWQWSISRLVDCCRSPSAQRVTNGDDDTHSRVGITYMRAATAAHYLPAGILCLHHGSVLSR